MPGPIIIIVEHDRGAIRPSAYELMSLAKKIQETEKAEIEAAILGDDIQKAAERFSTACAVPVTAVSHGGLREYNAALYTRVLAELLNNIEPSYVLVPHSSQGTDFAPGLALRLSAACVSGVEGICQKADKLRFHRSIFGGKIQAEIEPAAETTLLTLQPGSFKPHAAQAGAEPIVQPYPVSVPEPAFGTLALITVPSEGIDLSAAKVLVAAGRGVGEEENLTLVQQLAGQFPQSAVCGSRPIVDAGWMPYNRQVGITGATVSPTLYIACGISGATQHVSGMRSSGFVVSINSDPGAAIFNVSDICIVEDLKTFIPQFIELLGEK
jgi:electron transfer flavoprotein alpha subunit